tara:strand:+ start:617 stop:1276 length:660 start_codon:yes stop_codon:yes gene_type:complete
MKKRLSIALLLLILFSTYNIKFNINFLNNLLIQSIIVENNKIVNKENIKRKLSFLYNTNIFFIDKKDIEKKLREINFIESFELKKIYPNTIKIKITEKEPIAILQHMKERKFFTSKGNLIDFLDLKTFKDLPTVFGDRKNFLIFYNDLKTIKFPLNEIKTFYFFESKRWDLLTLKDQLIKLPTNNYDESLTNFMKLKDQPNFTKYKIFDYRIKDQLILK